MKLIKVLIVLITLSSWTNGYMQKCNNEKHRGEGTYYTGVDGSDSGHCSIIVAKNDFMHAAINKKDYKNSEPCGACISVSGPKGKVTVQIVDECPECKEGDIDLTRQAFAKIANVKDGRVPISWKFVPCPLAAKNKNIKVRHKDGSHQYWTAIQVYNTRYAINKLEYEKSKGKWKKMERTDYNYFLEPSGIKPPMKLRVTSVLGQKEVMYNVPFKLGSSIVSRKQFPLVKKCGTGSKAALEELATSDTVIKNGIMAYPNPVGDMLHVNNIPEKMNEIRIYDFKGKILIRKFLTSNSSDLQINTGFLSKGLYILQAISKHGSEEYIEKLVKN